MDHLSFNIREPEIAASIAIGEFLVVNPHQVENRRMKIVKVNRLVFCIVAIVVG
jgi:hypothetical protein